VAWLASQVLAQKATLVAINQYHTKNSVNSIIVTGLKAGKQGRHGEDAGIAVYIETVMK
jgi:hypothetical protein